VDGAFHSRTIENRMAAAKKAKAKLRARIGFIIPWLLVPDEHWGGPRRANPTFSSVGGNDENQNPTLSRQNAARQGWGNPFVAEN
jgi:hypothetical protein